MTNEDIQTLQDLRIQIQMIFEKLGCEKEELAQRLRSYDADMKNLKQKESK